MAVKTYGTGVTAEQKAEVLRALDEVLDCAKRMRAYVPHIARSAQGHAVTVPEYYAGLRPAPRQIDFEENLTNDDISRHNDLAHWMNQNVLIRICAVLDADTRSKVPKVLRDQSELVDFLYLLRQEFAHGHGKLKGRLLKEFKKLFPTVDTSGSEGKKEYCLSIDEVIEPLVLRIKDVVEQLPVEGESSVESLRIELRQRIHDSSFKPFRLELSNGAHCDVSHAGMNIVADTYIVVGHPAPDDPNPVYYDRTETVPLAAIVGVSPIPENAANA